MIDTPTSYLKTPLEMVQEFAMAMSQPLGETWYASHQLEDMRFRLIREEYGEISDESDQGTDPAAMLKELADMVVVIYGYAATYGWDLDEALRRVHASNMSKFGVDGKPLKRPDGKVLKGPNYKKPNLQDLVEAA